MGKAGERLRVGIVGACGRGASFKRACDATGRVAVQAACDVNTSELPEAAQRLGAAQQYDAFERMLDESPLDAVIIGTPMPLHVPQAVAALDRGLHVLSEVPAGVSVEQCRELVRAASDSAGVYMMAENYIYRRESVMIREMVRRGMFGEPYYGEGEYLHELKRLNEITRWRRRWQTGINGITYGTHSLGPLLQWMPGDRVMAVTCAGSGQRHRDPRGDLYENEASCVMLGRMRSGGLVKVRIDMLSDRPHAMNCYQLQGTDGCYESARARGEHDRIWLRSLCEDASTWRTLDEPELIEAFLPDYWKQGMEQAASAGHGGGDYFEVLDFVGAALGEHRPTVGIHEAMDMTLPGLISQQSIEHDGEWLTVPDSRQWVHASNRTREGPQLRMRYPVSRRDALTRCDMPTGYCLRQLDERDVTGYIELMDKAGFNGWTRRRVRETWASTLPGGAFVVTTDGDKPVATALAQHLRHERHPRGGQLGWLAADPAHAGKGLGTAVTAAATRRLIEVGYEDIYLLTDDFRLSAIAIYLKLGWEPVLDGPKMAERWDLVRGKLQDEWGRGQP